MFRKNPYCEMLAFKLLQNSAIKEHEQAKELMTQRLANTNYDSELCRLEYKIQLYRLSEQLERYSLPPTGLIYRFFKVPEYISYFHELYKLRDRGYYIQPCNGEELVEDLGTDKFLELAKNDSGIHSAAKDAIHAKHLYDIKLGKKSLSSESELERKQFEEKTNFNLYDRF